MMEIAVPVALVALGLIDLALIVVCARVSAGLEEMRRAAATSAGHQRGDAQVETTTGGARPDAPPRGEKKLRAELDRVRAEAEVYREKYHAEKELTTALRGEVFTLTNDKRDLERRLEEEGIEA